MQMGGIWRWCCVCYFMKKENVHYFILLRQLRQQHSSTPFFFFQCLINSCVMLWSDFPAPKVTLASSVPTKAKKSIDADQILANKSSKGCDSVDELHSPSECENKKCRETFKETGQCCSKSGVLRYALHLKFLCPVRKKASKIGQKKSLNDEERRFYLYNDLRVVFPQRHTDSDEGKVC